MPIPRAMTPSPSQVDLKACPDCVGDIPVAAKVCQHCGYRFHTPAEKVAGALIKALAVVMLAGLILIAIGFVASSRSSSTPPTTISRFKPVGGVS